MFSFSTHGYVLETSEEEGGKRCSVSIYQHGVLQYTFYSPVPYRKVRCVDIYEDCTGGVVHVLVSTVSEILLYTGNCVSTQKIAVYSPEHVLFVPGSHLIAFITTSQDTQSKKVLSFADYKNEFVINPDPFTFGNCEIVNVHACAGIVSAIAMKRASGGSLTMAIWVYFPRTSKTQRVSRRVNSDVVNSTLHLDKKGRTARMCIVMEDNSVAMASLDVTTENIEVFPIRDPPPSFHGLVCAVQDSSGKTYASLSDGVLLCCSEDMSSVRYLVTNIQVKVKDIIVNGDNGKVSYVTGDGKIVDVDTGHRHSRLSDDEEERLAQFFIDICI